MGLGLNIQTNTRSWKLLKMSQPFRPKTYPRINAVLLLLSLSVLVAPGNALNLSDVCHSSDIYSPFTKWPHDFLLIDGPTENTACWWWADCVLDNSPEVRKQQFAATSLVMGLVPLTLKEIAWPKNRIGLVSSPLNAFLEVLVRALGLIPVVKSDARSVLPPRNFWQVWFGIATPVLLTLAVLVGYAALAVMELYSKRSSLGCPYPLFICTWFIIALIPASIRKSI